MMNEERKTKNDVEIYYGHDLVAPRPDFSLLSSSFLQILLNPFNVWKLNPFLQPPYAYL